MATGNGKTNKPGGALLAWRANYKRNRRLSFGELDPATLQRAIDKATTAGAAVMFGLTSDGGAYSVVVLHNTEKVKEYPSTVDEMEAFLDSLADQFAMD